ncbi:hypothetical protein RRG08_062046 [Elysia crispata]|uniref:Uncharacterized protein n=1 Tax=Elysia crispata TaxID=231223 RepID=A0AAE1A3C0_9GAST|nr:hypothetical protein RRG08_062046 [Elysia crispata]
MVRIVVQMGAARCEVPAVLHCPLLSLSSHSSSPLLRYHSVARDVLGFRRRRRRGGKEGRKRCQGGRKDHSRRVRPTQSLLGEPYHHALGKKNILLPTLSLMPITSSLQWITVSHNVDSFAPR